MSDQTNTFRNPDRLAAYKALLIAFELWPEERIRSIIDGPLDSYSCTAYAVYHLFPGMNGQGIFAVIADAARVELQRRDVAAGEEER